MRRQEVVNAIRALVIVAVPFLASPASSADTRPANQSAADLRLSSEWMHRLVGTFRVDGTVELPDQTGNRQMSIRGTADCRASPDCLLDMTWMPTATDGTAAQDASPTQHWATIMYAMDSSSNGVMYMQVDDEGVAESGTALISDNKLVSASPCASSKGQCSSKTSITASPDGQSVRMETDVEVDGKRVGSRILTLHRESSVPETATQAAPSSAKPDKWRQDMEAWLARLQGSFTIKLDINTKIGDCRSVANGLQECKATKPVTYVSAANCRRIGAGPGLHCTFEDLRNEAADNNSAGVAGRLSLALGLNGLPTRMLFGIDPVARKISMMTVGSGSYIATATPSGADVTFKGHCEVPETKRARPCTWSLSMHAPPDGKKIVMTRARQNLTGFDSNGLNDLNEPHRFELTRVEQ